MVDVTIREYKEGKVRATLDNLRFLNMVIAEEAIDDLFASYHGSGMLKATIEKTKTEPSEISFDDLEDIPAEEPELIDDVEELFLEEVSE